MIWHKNYRTKYSRVIFAFRQLFLVPFPFLEQVLSRVDGAELQSLLGSDGPGRGRQRGRQNHQVSVMCKNFFWGNYPVDRILDGVCQKFINALLVLTIFLFCSFFFFPCSEMFDGHFECYSDRESERFRYQHFVCGCLLRVILLEIQYLEKYQFYAKFVTV